MVLFFDGMLPNGPEKGGIGGDFGLRWAQPYRDGCRGRLGDWGMGEGAGTGDRNDGRERLL